MIFSYLGDVDGSIEAILDSLSTYKSDQCKLDILQHGIGAPTMNDIDMASSFNGKTIKNVAQNDRIHANYQNKQNLILIRLYCYGLFINCCHTHRSVSLLL